MAKVKTKTKIEEKQQTEDRSNKYLKKNKISNDKSFWKNSSFQQQANSTHNTQHIAYNLQKNQFGCDNTQNKC